jgi:hypothetical protein
MHRRSTGVNSWTSSGLVAWISPVNARATGRCPATEAAPAVEWQAQQ